MVLFLGARRVIAVRAKNPVAYVAVHGAVAVVLGWAQAAEAQRLVGIVGIGDV